MVEPAKVFAQAKRKHWWIWPATEKRCSRDEGQPGQDRIPPSAKVHILSWRFVKACVPLLVSVGLLAWLIGRVHWNELISALESLNWSLLVPATIALVLSLYFWDGVCLRTLFSTEESPVSYQQCLRARGISYLASVVNYELGQATMAWRVARERRSEFFPAASRTVLLAYHDLLVLVTLGLLGAVWSDHALSVHARNSCAVALVALLLLGVFPFLLGLRYRERLQQSKWGAGWIDWTWKNSGRLLAWRVCYYMILLIYAGVAFGIAGLVVNQMTLLSTIPLVLLADALPSISGLGTRDAALQLLLPTSEKQTLLAISLVWSVGLILGRTCIGLFHLWRQTPTHQR